MSIDWDEIRRKHDERVAWEVEQGIRPAEPEPEKKPRPSRATGQPRKRPAPRPPKFDQAEIARLFDEGLRVGEIAERVGAHRTTVRRALNATGRLEANERKANGPRPQEECTYGHSMADAIPNAQGGGRTCRKCKRRRDREYQQRRHARKKAA